MSSRTRSEYFIAFFISQRYLDNSAKLRALTVRVADCGRARGSGTRGEVLSSGNRSFRRDFPDSTPQNTPSYRWLPRSRDTSGREREKLPRPLVPSLKTLDLSHNRNIVGL